VFDRELRGFRESVRLGEYVITSHGLDEMEDDELSVLDLESCVFTGSIVERQRDRRTREWKYVVEGRALNGDGVAVVAKRLAGGKMGVLTVYRL